MEKIRLRFWSIVICCIVVLAIGIFLFQPEQEEIFGISRDDLEMIPLSAEEQQDGSIYVIVEIVNHSEYTLEDNRLLIVGDSTTKDEYTSNAQSSIKDGASAGSSITVSITDPSPYTSVDELNGSFDRIYANERVMIGFTVPPEKALTRPIYAYVEISKAIKDNIMRVSPIVRTDGQLVVP